MIGASSLLALAAASPALAAYQGFNYGSTFTTGAAKAQSDFEAEFTTAQGLISAPGVFNSARLYTMIQGGTTNSPIEAIPAAISTKTSLLFGLWASAGDADFANELTALKSAISTYGSELSGLVAGISVGSEDLYRISPTGIANGENPGASPDTIISYIKQVRAAIAGTSLSSVPVGHVDTWTAWVNSSNNAVTDASDFVGVDAYPYFQNTLTNSISDGKSLFNSALSQTQAAVGGKEVWVTETGWPVSGPDQNLAVPSISNAKTYWDEVGCPLFGKTNVFWYTLQDATPTTPSPSFGIVGDTLTTTPLYDLSCNASDSSSSSSTSASASGTTSASGTASASGGASASNSATTISSVVASASGVDSGSPGISAGVGSVVTVSATGGAGANVTASSSGPLGTGSSGSGGAGSGGSGVNGTIAASSTPIPTTSASSVPTSGATTNFASFSVALAILAACLVL
ncbi:putative glucan endo-1,3-beta-glucosidase eglC [Cytospora mali]|uniref:Probable glucan endo-1,3-beta-glucosidase eglC n=1 Tax=Cytospora mali TaxID=578113 RepID=A0A194UYY7_CYTMA|nr:putative glucan endo-1,3-beta-glucosidase eglC [Valsa mali var. pyri (nom. inval.)]